MRKKVDWPQVIALGMFVALCLLIVTSPLWSNWTGANGP